MTFSRATMVKIQLLLKNKDMRMIELHEKELALLIACRKYRYGEIHVILRDGIPQRLKRVEMFDDLVLPAEPEKGEEGGDSCL